MHDNPADPLGRGRPFRSLVTGGASGIGAEVVRLLLQRGDAVTVLDRSAAADPRVTLVVGDVRSEEDQIRAVGTAAPEGALDVLVANAGVHDGGLTLLHEDPGGLARTFRHVLEVDVVGYLLSLQAAASSLLRAKGSVVLTLSDASFDVQKNGAGIAYATAKHAGLGLMRAAARDLAPTVRVNAVAPGGVATALTAEDGVGGSQEMTSDATALDDRLAGRTLLGRGASISEVAAAYVYLASPEAGGVTGQVLRVDGGLLS